MKKLLIAFAIVLTSQVQAREKGIDLFDFSQSSGYDPQGGIIAGSDGTLYGMNSIGGNGPCLAGAGCGTVYALSPPATKGGPWTMNVLYNFQGGQDGSVPQSTPTLDANGVLYGYTTGGTFGTVFRVSPPLARGTGWTFKILYIFGNGADGNLENVYGPLVVSNGSLYGVASGGAQGFGTVFRLTPDGNDNWTETTLYTFTGGRDGGNPNWIAGLDASGAAYVSTSKDNGLVARLTPPASGDAWKEQVIDRSHHPSNLLLNGDGSVFGFASKSTSGIVFRLAPPAGRGSGWTNQTIASVSEHRYGPVSLAPAPEGALVGAIFGDFDFYPGAIFELTPPSGSGSWTYSKLWGFGQGPDRNPNNAVTGRKGHIFAVMNGGDSTSGSLFELR